MGSCLEQLEGPLAKCVEIASVVVVVVGDVRVVAHGLNPTSRN
jgi:hypothetical protein